MPNFTIKRLQARFALLFLGFFLFCQQSINAQFAAMRFTRTKGVTKQSDRPVQLNHSGQKPPLATDPPTLADFTPKSAGSTRTIDIYGTQFDESASITFGGTQAADIVVLSATHIQAKVGDAISGNLVVTTNKGTANLPNFVFIPLPTITAVSRKTSSDGSLVLKITGTNFLRPAKVQINNSTSSVDALVLSPTDIQVTFTENSALTGLILTTPGGDVVYPDAPATAAGADLNLPDPGDGLTIIPTPSFDYSQVIHSTWLGFSARAWGNVLGTDSSRQRVGTKFLSPEISQFGLKLEFDARLSQFKRHSPFTASLECNLLWKKVSFFDTSLKQNTSFNPFVIHPRLGMVWSLVNETWFISVYGNFPAVVGSNREFADFFKAGDRNVFFYPEVDLGGLIPVANGGNQALKIQVNLLFNNGDAHTILGSTNGSVIPYIKFGFVSTF